MKNRSIIYICISAVLLIISNITLCLEVYGQRKNVVKLESKIDDFEKAVSDFQNYIEISINAIKEDSSSIMYRQKENMDVIQNDLAKINRKSDAQFSKTVGMSKTYDAILEEQKKKTIDTAELDKSILDEKGKATILYKNGRYSESYEEFRKLTELNPEDMECRVYKLKSLYCRNRGDSSTYAEILEDINILKQNAATDVECIEIETAILSEKEGVSE